MPDELVSPVSSSSPVPLGILTGFASLSPSTIGDSRALVVTSRYQLQSLSRSLLPNEHRIGACLRRLAPGRSYVEVKSNPAERRASFGGLMRCASVWLCPPCAALISERRRLELARVTAIARDRGAAVYLQTLTFRHHRWQELEALLRMFREAQRFMTAGKYGSAYLRSAFGFLGAVSALEVNHGIANGWHVHGHSLLFVSADEPYENLATYQRARWLRALDHAGATGNDHAYRLDRTYGAVADYVSKFGHEPQGKPWGAESELVKGHIKRGRGQSLSPFQLLAFSQHDTAAADLYREYAGAFKGRHQLQATPGLYDMLGVEAATDDELVSLDGDGMYLLALIERDTWKLIDANDMRDLVHNVAATGDYAALEDLVTSVGGRLLPPPL